MRQEQGLPEPGTQKSVFGTASEAETSPDLVDWDFTMSKPIRQAGTIEVTLRVDGRGKPMPFEEHSED